MSRWARVEYTRQQSPTLRVTTRNEYHPSQLWDGNGSHGPSGIDVEGPAHTLYDADERPVRRRIGYRPCQ